MFLKSFEQRFVCFVVIINLVLIEHSFLYQFLRRVRVLVRRQFHPEGLVDTPS